MKPVEQSELEAIARPVLEGLGYDLVHLEWKHEAGSWVMRAYIDRLGASSTDGLSDGVSHDDCTRASRGLSAELDVADIIHVRYTLEVSSPGLDRPLKREQEFRRFAGKRAKVRMRHPVGEARRNFSGTLLGADGGKLRIDVDGQPVELPIDDVEKANLQVEI